MFQLIVPSTDKIYQKDFPKPVIFKVLYEKSKQLFFNSAMCWTFYQLKLGKKKKKKMLKQIVPNFSDSFPAPNFFQPCRFLLLF